MSCCGNKRDVAPQSNVSGGKHNTIRAQKILGVDNNPQSEQVAKGFIPIRQTNMGGPQKYTKPEDYSRQNVSGSKSRLVGNLNELNFNLDEQPGVANTFDVPTFDYQTMLSHNIYANMNARSKLVIDDGNLSKIK